MRYEDMDKVWEFADETPIPEGSDRISEEDFDRIREDYYEDERRRAECSNDFDGHPLTII